MLLSYPPVNCSALSRIRGQLLVFLLIAALAVSIGAGQKPYPAVTEVKGGVRTVTNPDFPRDGTFIAQLTEEISCGEESGPPQGVLNNPSKIRVDAQGNIYVLDVGDVNIKVYDPAGRFVRAIGRKGQGPGEFGFLSDFDLMSKERIAAFDTLLARVSILTVEGRYLSGFSVSMFCDALRADENDVLYLAKSEEAKSGVELSSEFKEVPMLMTILRTDTAGRTPVPIASFPGEYRLLKASGLTVSTAFSDRAVLWILRPEGGFFAGFNEVYEVGAFAADGRKQFAFGRRFAPVKNAHYKGLAGERKTRPVYHDLMVDPDGDLWLDLYRPEGVKGALYDVFSPDGIYLKQVVAEQHIACIKDGKAYGFVRTDDGFRYVRRCKVELVPAAK